MDQLELPRLSFFVSWQVVTTCFLFFRDWISQRNRYYFDWGGTEGCDISAAVSFFLFFLTAYISFYISCLVIVATQRACSTAFTIVSSLETLFPVLQTN